MKYNKLMIMALVAGIASTGAVAAITSHRQGWPLYGEETSYEFGFNPYKYDSSDSNGRYHYFNGRGSEFIFEIGGNTSFNSTGKSFGLGTDGYFKNYSPIHGITSITLTSTNKANIYLYNNGVQVASASRSDTCSVPNGTYADSFKLTRYGNTVGSNTYITGITINFTCAEQGQ